MYLDDGAILNEFRQSVPERIARRINEFCGRTWLLEKISAWLDAAESRTLLITGAPGTGKSMVATWLGGAGPRPSNSEADALLQYVRSNIKATHFCSVGTGSTVPVRFIDNVSKQLSCSVPEYGSIVADLLRETFQISGTADAVNVAAGAMVVGAYVGHIDYHGDETSFDRIIREPIRRLYARGFSERMVLLVDALDESLTHTGSIHLADLLARVDDLPAAVRMIITTRPDPRILHTYRRALHIDLSDDPAAKEDVPKYVNLRVAQNRNIKADDLGSLISKTAQGNFLFACLLIDNLDSRIPQNDTKEIVLPSHLGDLYGDFLTRELHGKHWYTIYKKLLGVISVSQGDGLTRRQLSKLIGTDCEYPLQVCGQYLVGKIPDGPFRIFHKSFSDYLLEDPSNTNFHIDALDAHEIIATHFEAAFDANQEGSDSYGLRYLPTHLLELGNLDRIEGVLARLSFIIKRCSAGLVDELLRDFDAVESRFNDQWTADRPIAQFSDFVSRCAHLIKMDKGLCYQEAFNSSQQILRDAASHARNFEPSGEWLRRTGGTTRQQHNGAVVSMAFWGDDRYLAVSTINREVWLWNIAEGRAWRRCETPPSAAKSLTISPDRKFLAAGYGADEPNPSISGVIIWSRNGSVYRQIAFEEWVYTVRWRDNSNLIIGGGLPHGSEAAGRLIRLDLEAGESKEIGQFLSDRPIILTWDPVPDTSDEICTLSMDGIVCRVTPEYRPFTSEELQQIGKDLMETGDYADYDRRLAERRPIWRRIRSPCTDTFGYRSVSQLIGQNRVCMLGEATVPPEWFAWHTPVPEGVFVFDLESEGISGLTFGEEARLQGFCATCLGADPQGRHLAFGTAHGDVYSLTLDHTSTPEILHRGGFPTTAVIFSESGKTLAIGDAAGQIAVYEEATEESRRLVLQSEVTERPTAVRITKQSLVRMYTDHIDVYDFAEAHLNRIALPPNFQAVDIDVSGQLAVVLTSNDDRDDNDGRQCVHVVQLAEGRIIESVELPDRQAPNLEVGLSEDPSLAHVIRLGMAGSKAELLLGYPEGYVMTTLQSVGYGSVFVLPESARRRTRIIHVVRMGERQPEISLDTVELLPLSDTVICAYSDNANHPNVTGEAWIWNSLTGEGSELHRFGGRICALQVARDRTLIVGTDQGEASSWRYDDGWREVAVVAHPLAVVAVAYSAQRQLTCSASRDGLIFIWRTFSGEVIFRTFIEVEPVRVSFVEEHSVLVVDCNGEMHTWEMEGYRAEEALTH